MLYDERMCGKGMMCQRRVQGVELSVKHGPEEKEEERKRAWHKGGRRRGPSDRRAPLVRRGPHRPRRASIAGPLRPANVRGRRAPGMRAPRNTNQFLMREKYQLLHMRSDSVGTDSGSDCELDPADMDSYLGVLENAHGALLDGPELLPFASGDTIHFFAELEREDSMQYFPSENDFMQSEDFMQRDFKQFCDTVACT